MSNLTQRRSNKKEPSNIAIRQSQVQSVSPKPSQMFPQQPSYDPQGPNLRRCSFQEDEEKMKCEFMREAICTITWSILACMLRGGLVLIFKIVSFKEITKHRFILFRLSLEIVSGVLSFITNYLPSQFENELAPGFIFVAPILMINLRRRFGTMPCLPVRICEMMMGRLTPRELAMLVPIHFLASVVGAFTLNILLPGIGAAHTLSPIIFSEDNFWVADFLRETVVTAVFCIGMLVLPEISRLNKLPVVLTTTLLLIPVFLYSVDAEGMGSSFSPDLVYALRLLSRHEEVPLRQSSHLFGPMLGGALGGYIMSQYFPDDGFHHVPL